MSDSRFDARGCLTDAGLASVRGAPPGRVDSELAEHLASCRRCQYRLLSGGKNPPSGQARPRGAPLGRRLAALGIAGLVLVVAALALLSVLLR